MKNGINTATEIKADNTVQTVTFDKDEWMRQKQADRDSAYRMADEMAELVKTNGRHLEDVLDLMARFPKHSVNNLLLIAAQRPEATDLKGFNEWKELGTSIKKGETGITLLEGREYTRKDGTEAVRYSTRRVFDISQTKALSNPHPEFPLKAATVLGALYNDPVCEVTVDESMSGRPGDDAVYDHETAIIRLAKVMKMSEAIPPLTRELARAYMLSGDNVPDNTEEAAVCAAYVFCRRKGASTEGFDLSLVTAGLSELEAKDVRSFLSRVKDVSNGIREQMNIYLSTQRAERTEEPER